MPCDCKDSCCDGQKCTVDLAAWWKDRPPFKTAKDGVKLPVSKLLPVALYNVFHADELDMLAGTYQGDKDLFAQLVKLKNTSSRQNNDLKAQIPMPKKANVEISGPLEYALKENFMQNFSCGTCCTEACMPVCGCPYPVQDYTFLKMAATPIRWAWGLQDIFYKTVWELPATSIEACGARGVQPNYRPGDVNACCNGMGCTCFCCCTSTASYEYTCNECSPGGNCGTAWPLAMYFCGATSKTIIQLSTESEGSIRSAFNSHSVVGVAATVGVVCMVPLTTAGFLWGGSIAASALIAPCFSAAGTAITTTMALDVALKAGLVRLACLPVTAGLKAADRYLATNGVCTIGNKKITVPSKFAVPAMERAEARNGSVVTRIGDGQSSPVIANRAVSPNAGVHLVVPLSASAKAPPALAGNLVSPRANGGGKPYQLDGSPKLLTAAARPASATPKSPASVMQR